VISSLLVIFTVSYFLQIAFFRYARFTIPRIPVILTANPTSVMARRTPTLDVIPKLRKLIRKPNTVTTNPIIAMCFLLFLLMFPRLAFDEERARGANQYEPE
jgi:hypothetical protein